MHNLVNDKLKAQRIERFQTEFLKQPLKKEFTNMLNLFLTDTSFKPQFVPTLEIVKKRYCVNHDNLFPWKHVCVVIAAMCKGLIKYETQSLNFSKLIEFLQEFLHIVKLIQKSRSVCLQTNLTTLLNMNSVHEIYQELQKSEYTSNFNLIEAGTCLKGTCI